MNIIAKTQKIVKKFYLRYSLATEFYILEPWEIAVIHALLVLFFGSFWYFNSAVVAPRISQFRGVTHYADIEVL